MLANLKWWLVRLFSGNPHFVIGADYLRRWYVIPRNRWLNVYLHKFLHDDDDRALHDHPWWFISIMLKGGYQEILPLGSVKRRAPSVVFRPARHTHRVVLNREYDNHAAARIVPCWTLIITGRVSRQWGFHCPQGWRHWKDFTAPHDYGQVGRGCD